MKLEQLDINIKIALIKNKLNHLITEVYIKKMKLKIGHTNFCQSRTIEITQQILKTN